MSRLVLLIISASFFFKFTSQSTRVWCFVFHCHIHEFTLNESYASTWQLDTLRPFVSSNSNWGTTIPHRHFVIFLFNVQESVDHNYILMYTYIQQDANSHSLFISGNCSACFGWYLHPSSGAHKTVSTASGTYQTVILHRVWQMPDAVDTVVCAPDDGRRYHPKYIEQFPEINKLRNVASCWIYIRIYLLPPGNEKVDWLLVY